MRLSPFTAEEHSGKTCSGFWTTVKLKGPLGSSVVDRQPKEPQQLLVLRLNEVSRLLAALILQLGVGAQRQQVAEGKPDTLQVSEGEASAQRKALSESLFVVQIP